MTCNVYLNGILYLAIANLLVDANNLGTTIVSSGYDLGKLSVMYRLNLKHILNLIQISQLTNMGYAGYIQIYQCFPSYTSEALIKELMVIGIFIT